MPRKCRTQNAATRTREGVGSQGKESSLDLSQLETRRAQGRETSSFKTKGLVVTFKYKKPPGQEDKRFVHWDEPGVTGDTRLLLSGLERLRSALC